MQQTARPQTYSPAEILEAGRRAEAEGRRDYAAQFYRHLTDYYAATPEAVEARHALQRVASAAPQPATRPEPIQQAATYPVRAALDDSYTPPAVTSLAVRPAATAHPMPAASLSLPAPARGFWLGRGIAWLLLVVGGVMMLAGLGVLGYAASQGLLQPTPAGASAIVVAPSLIAGGLLLALIGELCRAAFRAANASSDLAAIQRALAETETRTPGSG